MNPKKEMENMNNIAVYVEGVYIGDAKGFTFKRATKHSVAALKLKRADYPGNFTK